MIIDSHVYCLPARMRKPDFDPGLKDKIAHSLIYAHADSARALSLSAPETILHSMNESKIDISQLIAFPWASLALCKETNDHLLEHIAKEKRFFCLCSIQPTDKGWQKEAERCLKANAKGLNINPKWQGYALDDIVMDDLAQFAKEQNTVIMVHIDQSYKKSQTSGAHLIQLMERHPETKFIAAHLGGLIGIYNLHPPLQPLFKNLWFDTSVSSTMKMVEFYVAAGLADKLLFGTDYPFNHDHSQIESLRALQNLSLAPNVLADILSNNVLRLNGI